ncbi:homeobox domain-containing protein [Parasitella parasitica]|nr:homeobox domain-containing protein [Parasitella parasitica]
MSESTPPLQQSSSAADDSKKRTRVTPSQLSVLEETFSVSATPDSKMRKQLAYKLQMPERSIQIWFQNRRAKVKMLQRRVLLRQEQEAARARLCAEATSQHGFPYWYSHLPNRQQKLPIHRAWSSDMVPQPQNAYPLPPPPPPLSQMFQQQQQQHYDTPPSISVTGPTAANELEEDIYSLTVSPSPTPQSFLNSNSGIPKRMESEPLSSTNFMNQNTTGLITATAVTVGSWHRMKISQQDLMCFYKLNERAFSWHIRDSNYHFKMMISFDSIASIELNVLEDHISAQIDMDLLEAPIFFMENNSTWVQCSDFTEGMQASAVLHHTVRGLAADLRQELLAIAGMDERLCQLTRFPTTIDLMMPPPSSIHHHHAMAAAAAAAAAAASSSSHQSLEHAFLMQQQDTHQQNWRHQSVPLSSAKDYWVQPFPI